MAAFLNIIQGTPLWVWGIFAYILFIGFKSMKDRIIFIPVLFIIPLVLISLKYAAFFNLPFLSFTSLALGAFLGFILHQKTPLIFFKETRKISVPGNKITFILLFSFFAVRYICGYKIAIYPHNASFYTTLDGIISLLFAGYFLGRSLCFTYRFLKA